jgi:hypothetical protein
MKKEALNLFLWKTSFGNAYGYVVRQHGGGACGGGGDDEFVNCQHHAPAFLLL